MKTTFYLTSKFIIISLKVFKEKLFDLTGLTSMLECVQLSKGVTRACRDELQERKSIYKD